MITNSASVHIRALFISLAMLTSPLIAADFRGSELGGPCSSISDHELSLGSRELGNPSLENQHRFFGRAFDRDVTIIYLCKDGILKVVDLRPAPQSTDDPSPSSNFDVLYLGLTSIYGAPAFEVSNPSVSVNTGHPRAGDSPREYEAFWKGNGYRVHLTLHAVHGPYWAVFAVITP